MGDAELHLVHDERLVQRRGEQFDLPWGVIRHPELAHLSRAVQRVESGRHLIGFDQGIRAVQQQEVEVVGLEGGEGLINGTEDVLCRVVPETRADAHLRLDRDSRPLGR